jgi:hypothetical protein
MASVGSIGGKPEVAMTFPFRLTDVFARFPKGFLDAKRSGHNTAHPGHEPKRTVSNMDALLLDRQVENPG